MATANSPFKITATTTRDVLSGAGTRLRARLIRNLGSVSIFLGGSDVTSSGATMGWEVAAGAEFTDSISNGDIYVITASSTAVVQVWEVE